MVERDERYCEAIAARISSGHLDAERNELPGQGGLFEVAR